MKQNRQYKRFIISGGGTGGHIFPALSIARALLERMPDAGILFVGAEGRMEMEKIPAAGFRIIGLPVQGLVRKFSLKNFIVLLKLLKSLLKAGSIIREFKPDAVIGTGGYVSAPVLGMAGRKGIPTFIQEQNSYPGISNKLLAKKAKKIFVAYPGMEKFFPGEKILLTGNPVRKDLKFIKEKTDEASEYFKLGKEKKIILIIGGSLGAGTLNDAVKEKLEMIAASDIRLIWQSGSYYYESAKQSLDRSTCSNVKLYDFISRMDLAYAIADLVVSRAGAGTISELCLCAKPAILVPSPNVAEDHQTHNAMAMLRQGAAEMIEDKRAVKDLFDEAIKLVSDEERLKSLSEEAAKLAVNNSAELIAAEIEKFVLSA